LDEELLSSEDMHLFITTFTTQCSNANIECVAVNKWHYSNGLQCFDAVDWVAGRASGL